jgi:2,3-bisphosphoglycerate-independent phosphoglycerate mutase
MDPKKYVLIVPDGAADVHRAAGLSPMAAARTPYADFLARQGVCGLMQTLYDDMPKGSIVAQLGMLGWDPYRYFPHGRASCELLALDDVHLDAADLVFRANLVAMEGPRLVSYNGHYVESEQAAPLVDRINGGTRQEFPDFELYHNSDFRNTLVIRGAALDPRLFVCSEPHESEGMEFDLRRLVGFKGGEGDQQLAATINRYLGRVRDLLAGESANMLFPWSPSGALHLPRFADHTGFTGKAGIVGGMDFLVGIAKAGEMDFFRVGNGRPDTDYAAKGCRVVELLEGEYELVVCHINGPDEASHMGDLAAKIRSLEAIDEQITRRVVAYFERHPEVLGGVMIVPDHYTNHSMEGRQLYRTEAHSIHPVPFALWNGQVCDAVETFDEDAAREGLYGDHPINHLDLLRLLGVSKSPWHDAEPGTVGRMQGLDAVAEAQSADVEASLVPSGKD